MELTVVSSNPDEGFATSAISGLRQRLFDRRWAAVIVGTAAVHDLEILGGQTDSSPVATESVDLGAVISDHPGGEVLVVCPPAPIRDLVADVLDVDRDALPLPAQASITRIRASRKGVRSLICFNDTLHLPMTDTTDIDTRTREELAVHE